MVSSPSGFTSRAAYDAYIASLNLPARFPTFTCSVCHKQSRGYGNNPAPLFDASWGECCDYCNAVVVFLRLMLIDPNRRQDFIPAQWIYRIIDEDPSLIEIYERFGPRPQPTVQPEDQPE